MPRKAREKVECGIYHISIRGNNKQDIFLDNKDRIEYLARLQRYKETYKVGIYAYCLMTNHVHLLVFDNGQDISRFMQGLNLSYVIYFNRKYKCSGHLFQDRFTSNVVDNEAYLLQVSKYIHLNPVRAQIVQKPEEYQWSSYCNYIEGKKDGLVDIDFVLNYFGSQNKQSKLLYRCYVEEKEVQEERNTREEIASTQEDKKVPLSLRGIVRVEHDMLISKLEKYWGMSIKDIMCNKLQERKKEMLIYLVALVERLSYKKVSKLLNMSEVYISLSIKKIVGIMIKNVNVKLQRESIILLLEQ